MDRELGNVFLEAGVNSDRGGKKTANLCVIVWAISALARLRERKQEQENSNIRGEHIILVLPPIAERESSEIQYIQKSQTKQSEGRSKRFQGTYHGEKHLLCLKRGRATQRQKKAIRGEGGVQGRREGMTSKPAGEATKGNGGSTGRLIKSRTAIP